MASSLSDTTKGEFNRAFHSFDKDRDGKLNKEDLESLMNHLNFYPNEKEITEILGEFAEAENHQVSYPDFLEIMAVMMFDGSAEVDLMKAFKIYDKENRGFISSVDMKQALADINSELTIDQVASMIQGLTDHEGKINYIELVKEFLFN